MLSALGLTPPPPLYLQLDPAVLTSRAPLTPTADSAAFGDAHYIYIIYISV